MIDKTKFDEVFSKLPEEKLELAKLILDELETVENKITGIRDKEFIKVNKNYPNIMRETSYSKLYIKLLQQKTLLVKTFNSIISKNILDGEDDENPIKAFKELMASRQ
jgi:hypothetical protein